MDRGGCVGDHHTWEIPMDVPRELATTLSPPSFIFRGMLAPCLGTSIEAVSRASLGTYLIVVSRLRQLSLAQALL